MALKDLSVRIGADTTGFDRGLKRVRYGLSSLVKSGLAVAGAAFGLKALEGAYLGLESSVLRVNSLFGDSAKYIRYFAENTAKGFGMAESSAYQYAAIYGNLFKNITSGTAENSKVTIAMLKASAVVASKTGRTMEDVMDRIRSGLLGNTEAIEDLGINVNVAMLESTDAFKRMADGRSWEKLTFYEQQQVRTLAILEQANKNFGTEVQQGSAFSLAVLSGAFKGLMSTMGQFLNAGLQPIIKGLTQLVQWATAGLKALASLMGLKMTMGDTSGTDAATAAQEALTNEVEATNKAVKQTTAGFDEVNVLAQGSGEEATAEAATDNSPFAGIAMPEFVESVPDTTWVDTLKTKFDELRASEPFTAIQGALTTAWGFISPIVDGFRQRFGTLWADLLTLAQPFSDWLSAGLPMLLSNLTTWWGLLASSAGDAFLQIWDTANAALFPIFEWFVTDGLSWFTDYCSGFMDAAVSLLGAVKSVFDDIWSGVVEPAMKLVSRIVLDTLNDMKAWWDTWGSRIISGLIEAFNNIRDICHKLWTEIFQPIIGKALEMLTNLWDNHIRGMLEAVREFVGKMYTAALDIFNKFISPVVQWLTTLFGPTFREVFGAVIDTVGSIIAVIVDVGKMVFQVLGGIIDFIAGVFTGDWSRAWNGIKTIFGSVWDFAKGAFVKFVNFIIDGINTMIKGILAPINALIKGWNATIGKVTGQIPMITLSIPKIPELATGGIIERPTIAMLGEQGKEAVVPLENTSFVDAIASAVGTAVLSAIQVSSGSSRSGDSGDTVIEMDGREVARLLLPKIDQELTRLGRKPLLRLSPTGG